MEKLLETCKNRQKKSDEAEKKYFESSIKLLKKYLKINKLDFLGFKRNVLPYYWNEDDELEMYYAVRLDDNGELMVCKSMYYYEWEYGDGDDDELDEENPWSYDWKYDVVELKHIAFAILTEIESRIKSENSK